jgi:hypothetical protein
MATFALFATPLGSLPRDAMATVALEAQAIPALRLAD